MLINVDESDVAIITLSLAYFELGIWLVFTILIS